MPVYYIHHPSGNVVIRTDNAYVVLWHQHRGWLTTTSFSDVLQDHLEWSSPTSTPFPSMPLRALQRHRICAILVSPLRSFLALSMGRSTSPAMPNPSIAPLESNGSGEASSEANFGPIHWMTALERGWYEERGYAMPVAGWIECAQWQGTFEYRLESGKWELRNDALLSYASASSKVEKEGVD